MMRRFSSITLTAIERCKVASAMESDADIFSAIFPATPRSGCGRGGPGRAGFGGAPTSMPHGKAFVARNGRNLIVFVPATKASKLLIDTTLIDAAAMTTTAEDGPADWTNRRARSGGMQFSAD